MRDYGRAGAARVSCGSLLLRAALHAVTTTVAALREGGNVETAQLPTYQQVDALHRLFGDDCRSRE
ncbi:MAG: isocitrate lyase/phosphoenolpyruvate mutase family protein [Actinomycetota bacterium]|nr:isocitrate lyase/phosphoenolpyruvate mutase family protein [Actinomycetota bacterium]